MMGGTQIHGHIFMDRSTLAHQKTWQFFQIIISVNATSQRNGVKNVFNKAELDRDGKKRQYAKKKKVA